MKKKWILPIIAVVMAIVAVLVIVLIPGRTNQTSAPVVLTETDGNILIRTASLSSDQISFLRLENSRIELLARLGDDGKTKVALGTCQSCNGAPGAYYTQQGNVLQCNNCGLTFPLNVIDKPGNGCHPITIDPAMITETAEGLVLDAQDIARYEPLFEKVAVH